jgi:hypothetical protein
MRIPTRTILSIIRVVRTGRGTLPRANNALLALRDGLDCRAQLAAGRLQREVQLAGERQHGTVWAGDALRRGDKAHLLQLAAAPFPKLVISGNHSPAFEAVCDTLAARLRAQRAYVTGAGHATPGTGNTFNDTLEAFIRTV